MHSEEIEPTNNQLAAAEHELFEESWRIFPRTKQPTLEKATEKRVRKMARNQIVKLKQKGQSHESR